MITAGTLDEQLDRNNICMEWFSAVVLDEAHHASYNHKYIKILNKIKNIDFYHRSRILGLTA